MLEDWPFVLVCLKLALVGMRHSSAPCTSFFLKRLRACAHLLLFLIISLNPETGLAVSRAMGIIGGAIVGLPASLKFAAWKLRPILGLQAHHCVPASLQLNLFFIVLIGLQLQLYARKGTMLQEKFAQLLSLARSKIKALEYPSLGKRFYDARYSNKVVQGTSFAGVVQFLRCFAGSDHTLGIRLEVAAHP